MRKIKKKFKKGMLVKCISMALFTGLNVVGNNTLVFAEDIKTDSTSQNEVTLNDSTYDINGTSETHDGSFNFVYGGGNESNTDAAQNNKINIFGGNWYGIFGGVSTSGNVTDNVININGGYINGGVVGGFTFFSYDNETVAGNVMRNTVILNDGTVDYISGGEVGYSYVSSESSGEPNTSKSYFQMGGNVSENRVEIKGGTVTSGVIGGSALTGSANNNSIDISGGKISGLVIAGEVRYPTSNSSVTGNSIGISNSPDLSNAYLIGGIFGEEYSSEGNTLNMNTKNITVRNISGFDTLNFELPSMNSGDYIFNITGGGNTDFSNINMNVSLNGDSNIKNGDKVTLITNSNGINISGMSINGNVVSTANSSNSIETSYTERGYEERNDEEETSTGSATGTISKGITEDFDFTLDNVTDSNGNITSLAANISNGRVNRQIDAFPGPNTVAVNVATNHTVDLPDTPIDMMLEIEEVSLKSDDGTVVVVENGEDVLSFTIEDDGSIKVVDNENTSINIIENEDGSISVLKDGEGIIDVVKNDDGTIAIIKEGDEVVYVIKNDDGSISTIDKKSGKTSQLDNVVEIKEQRGYEIYAHVGGGHMKFKTGNGSYVKTDSGNYDMGIARKFRTRSGMFIFAPMVEYGHSKYDSFFPTQINDIYGNGHSKYTAGGVIFRNMNNSGFYYEGSVRAGRSDTKFASDDFLRSGVRTRVTYHTESPIFMGHTRLGYVLRMDKNNLLDIYGIYSYARQSGDDTYLSSGEHYNFSSVDSSKIKIGYRLTSQVSRISQIYSGLAYQYESAADSVARTGDISSKSVGSSGSSGMLEIGWLIKPLKGNPWAVDINTTGWIGHQEGFRAMAKIKKSF